jgi:hypothetical protein
MKPKGAADGHRNRHHDGGLLLVLQGGIRFQANDCIQGWPIRLSQLRSHCATWCAGLQVQLRRLFDTVAENVATDFHQKIA